MSTQLSLENFEKVYDDTYNRTLMYIVCNSASINDVNDLLQETYVELYKILKRKKYLELDNYQNYIIGIAKKKIQRFYGKRYQLKTFSIFSDKDENEYELEIPSNFDLEMDIVTKLEAEEIWKYIKQKDIKIIKIFYLYYYMDLKLSEISNELKISESNVKNILYRTITDIKKNVKIEGDINV